MSAIYGITCGLFIFTVSLSHAADTSPKVLRIYYMEEQPMEYTLEVTIDASGDTTIHSATLKPDCPESWQKACWTKSERHVHLSSNEWQKLALLSAQESLTSIPRELTPAPASGRVQLVVNIEGGRKIEVLSSTARAGQNSEFRVLRDAIFAIAE